MFKAFRNQFQRNRLRLKNLGKDFIANKISAAGVSYIVNQRSKIRRYLWFIGVISVLSFMSYMTFNVVSEYLSHPKMLIQEDIISSRLPFPAVTVCSLNPISERYAYQSSLKKLIKLQRLLREIPSLQSRTGSQKSCMREPLCKWSWFLETCECVENPCLTEFCMPNNETHCLCSSAICTNNKFDCDGADDPYHRSSNVCACDSADEYELPFKPKQNLSMKLEDILPLIDDEDLQTIVQLIWNSKTYDLSDVEEGLMPTLEDIYNYGVTFDNLVASCSFEKSNCLRQNFSILYHPKYGKCYMFNFVGGGSDHLLPINTNNYGSNSGLKLLLRVKDQDNLDLVRAEVGARIVIHDPYELPFVAEYGIDVKPMDMTAIAVSLTKIERLSYPWGDCTNKISEGNDNEPYSILGCEKKCGFEYMTSECNCTMRHLMHGSVLSRSSTHFELCDIFNETQKECVQRVVQDLEDRRVNCHCIPPCNETIYRHTVTSSELNRDYYNMVKAIRTMAVSSRGKLRYYNTTDEKSMIGVKVYYNTFQITKQKEVQSYSWETLVANIGGNLGFFMGLTLITFLEIIEFFWDAVSTACRPPEENKVYTVQDCAQPYYRKNNKRKIWKEINSLKPRRTSIPTEKIKFQMNTKLKKSFNRFK